jgi:indolepyruvate ferredoxin oxidoreductase
VLAFDLLTAADSKNIGYGDPNRTTAVVSTSRTPTGDMVYDGAVEYPSDDSLLSRLDMRSQTLIAFDALAAADTLFGTTTPANFLLVGAAYQTGGLPIPAAAIEEAIAINGVAVTANQSAFRWGRVAVDSPVTFRSATTAPADAQRWNTVVPTHLLDDCSVTGPTRELL